MKKWFIGLIAALGILLAPSAVMASSWYWIGPDDTGAQYYLDNASAHKDGNISRVWIKVNFGDGSYVEEFTEVRQDHFYRVIDEVDYDTKGAMTKEQEFNNAEWRPIIPDTMMENIYKLTW